jgi:hypothetical protein
VSALENKSCALAKFLTSEKLLVKRFHRNVSSNSSCSAEAAAIYRDENQRTTKNGGEGLINKPYNIWGLNSFTTKQTIYPGSKLSPSYAPSLNEVQNAARRIGHCS